MTEQTAPAAKVYERTENGTVAYVSVREGLEEINHATMGGRREVETMSSISRTDYAIEYKDGRKVTLVRVDAPAEQPAKEIVPGPKVWTGEATRIVTVKSKRYVVGTVRPSRNDPSRAFVYYWSERSGEAFGPTRDTSSNAKPGTVGRAIWDALNR
ncbi:hypothetical protein ACW7N6_38245 [Streptomyces sp. UC1A3]